MLLNKCNSCQVKRDRNSSCEWVVNLTLNIFNTVKLENLIACINTLILTALVFSKDPFVFNAAMFDIYEFLFC